MPAVLADLGNVVVYYSGFGSIFHGRLTLAGAVPAGDHVVVVGVGQGAGDSRANAYQSYQLVQDAHPGVNHQVTFFVARVTTALQAGDTIEITHVPSDWLTFGGGGPDPTGDICGKALHVDDDVETALNQLSIASFDSEAYDTDYEAEIDLAEDDRDYLLVGAACGANFT